jgi:hypothetical protein
MNDYKTPEEFLEGYGYDVQGSWYPRVTRIVEIKAKPALYRFYAELPSFAEGERIKEQSASEGTKVHEAIESLLTGGSPALTDDVRAAVHAFEKFQQEKNIQVDKNFVEYRLANHDERYAGTMDALARIDGAWGVLDIKTSQSIYRDYNLQTSAYMAALEKDFPNITTRWILRIDQFQVCPHCGATRRTKGGREKIRLPYGSGLSYMKFKNCRHEWPALTGHIELLECPNWKTDYKAFLGAKKLWEWEHEDMLRQIGYLNG